MIYAILGLNYDMICPSLGTKKARVWYTGHPGTGVYNANYDNAEHDYICRVTWRVVGVGETVIPIPRAVRCNKILSGEVRRSPPGIYINLV